MIGVSPSSSFRHISTPEHAVLTGIDMWNLRAGAGNTTWLRLIRHNRSILAHLTSHMLTMPTSLCRFKANNSAGSVAANPGNPGLLVRRPQQHAKGRVPQHDPGLSRTAREEARKH